MAPSSFLSFNLPLPSLALVLDRDHELVGLVDQVRRRGEHRVGPAKKILTLTYFFHSGLVSHIFKYKF